MDRRRAAGRQLVVNIGELLELATNGIGAPPSIAWCRRRAAAAPLIAFFLGAQLDAVVLVYTLPPEPGA